MQIEKIQCTECTIVKRQGRIIGYYLYEIQIRSGEWTLEVTDDARRKREEKRERKKNGYK